MLICLIYSKTDFVEIIFSCDCLSATMDIQVQVAVFLYKLKYTKTFGYFSLETVKRKVYNILFSLSHSKKSWGESDFRLILCGIGIWNVRFGPANVAVLRWALSVLLTADVSFHIVVVI